MWIVDINIIQSRYKILLRVSALRLYITLYYSYSYKFKTVKNTTQVYGVYKAV